MITAVIFDLDGTLVDSAPDIQVAVNKLLACAARPPLSLDAVTTMIGDGAPRLVERAFEATGNRPSPEDVPVLTRRFLGFYEGHTTDLTHPYPGVTEALERLRAAERRLGICTNKPERPTRELLRDLDLARFFGAVFGGDTIDGIRKPDPRLIQAVLGALGADPSETVMVGDNANDVGAARAAGIPVILRAGGYTPIPAEELGADGVINDFGELNDAIHHLASTRGKWRPSALDRLGEGRHIASAPVSRPTDDVPRGQEPIRDSDRTTSTSGAGDTAKGS